VSSSAQRVSLVGVVLAAVCPGLALAEQTTGVCAAAAGERPPIIDVHMHAAGTPPDPVIAELDVHNVIAVVLSSLMFPRTQEWAARDARFIPSLAFRDASIPVENVRGLVQRRAVAALGELGFAYAGLRPDDPSLEPYYALAEELDVPVAIHMAGGGLPDVPAFRVRLGDPMMLEEVLVRHPRLRVNLMHAGLPFLEGTLAIMRRYPQVFADLSKISDAGAYPREQFHEYLRGLMRANLGDRLMFGSDAAGPGAIGPSIDGITSATFLTEGQKRAILCENAARFFRLTTRPR
jgi:predicted TIM-barrel fold metal-dependent hydrolase